MTLSYIYFSDSISGRVIRFNADGSIDDSIGINNKPDFIVNDLAWQNDKLLLGGFIESFNGVLKNRITRVGTSQVLAAKWISVNASIKQSNDIAVKWQTASEINVQKYIVQRSINGSIFSNITSIIPNKGNNTNQYEVTDADAALLANKIYYRVQETDNDGKISYSQIVFVTVENGNAQITFYPNPVKNVLHIENLNPQLNTSIQVINNNGKILKTVLVSAKNYNLDISNLASGIYYLEVIDSDKHKYKFIKQ